MATRKLSKIEYSNWLKYRKQGCTMLSRCKVNPIGLGGGLKHELMKFKKYFELRTLGHNVILEAVPCGNSKVRHDLVDLTTGEIYEIVSSNLSDNVRDVIKTGVETVNIVRCDEVDVVQILY